jgi:hypothetical protein
MYIAQDYFSCCDQGITYLSMFDVLVERLQNKSWCHLKFYGIHNLDAGHVCANCFCCGKLNRICNSTQDSAVEVLGYLFFSLLLECSTTHIAFISVAQFYTRK